MMTMMAAAAAEFSLYFAQGTCLQNHFNNNHQILLMPCYSNCIA